MAKVYGILEEFKNSKEFKKLYDTYLRTIQKDICSYPHEGDWDNNVYKMLFSQSEVTTLPSRKRSYSLIQNDFINIIDGFIEKNNWLAAMTIVDTMCDRTDQIINQLREKVKTATKEDASKIKKHIKSSFGDKRSALRAFRRFLKDKINDIEDDADCSNDKSSRKHVKINKPDLSKIDGFEGLIDEFEKDGRNGKDKFIKYAVEQSYFFDPTSVVVIQMEKIRTEIVNGLNGIEVEGLPARKSEDNGTYEGDFYIVDKEKDIKIKVKFDSNGNNEVKKKINVYTGFTINANNCIFRNYIISHLWGRASDPRYFTNFWNIVLVPVWANSLLDKNCEKGTLGGKLKDTFLTISKILYELNDKSSYWNDLKMDEPKVETKGKMGDYTIRLLCGKKGKNEMGIIKTKKIKKSDFEKL